MKKIFRQYAALISISLFTCVLYAQNEDKEPQSVSLTVDKAVEYALQNSRALKSNDIDLEIKKRAAAYSWNVFLPNISATGTMARSNEYAPGTGDIIAAALASAMGKTASVPTDFANEEARWNVVGGVSASLNLSLAYIATIQKAKVEYEGGKLTWEQSQKETVMNIKKLFYGLLLQQESLNIKKTTLKNAYDRMVQAETSYKNGTIPELALLQTQVNYQNTKPEVETAERALNQQLDTLAFLLGMPVGTKITLDGSIEPVYINASTEQLLDRFSSNDLKLRSLDNTIHTLKLGSTAIDLSTWFPAIALNYGWSPAYTGEAFDFYKDIGKDDKWYDTGSFSVTLAWNLTNMLPFSTNAQNKKDLKSNLAKLELTRQTLVENQKVEVRKAVDTLNEAREQIDAMGRTVKLAQRSYEVTLRNYRSGMTELLDVRDAETSLNQAKLGQLNQKFQYISALMDLENTLNTDLVKEFGSQPVNK